MFFGLRDYQLQGAHFIGKNKKCGLFYDCGLGKTLTILSALNHYSDTMLPALIVAPKRVARNVWPEEIQKWGFPFSVSLAAGASKKVREKRMAEPSDVTIINPESLSTVNVTPRWRTVIFDESTYFKNPEAKRWSAAATLAGMAERVILATATPISGRGHLDLWGQFGLFGLQNPLGTWWEFTSRHFSFDMYDRPRLRSGSEETLNQLVAPFVHRVDRSQIHLPELVEINEPVEMPASSRMEYDSLTLEEFSYAPMRTLAAGFVYDHHWTKETQTKWSHTAKLEALSEIRQSAGDDNLLVFTNFVASMQKIVDTFGAVTLGGEKTASRVIQDWNGGRVPMLVMNPRSGGHGLNLQFGGRRVVWFDLPDSGELWTQANARLYRSGQTETVFVHKIICKNTIDETINALLSKKRLNEENLLAAVT